MIKTMLGISIPIAEAFLLDAFGFSRETIFWTILASGWLIVAYWMQSEVLSSVRPLSTSDRITFHAIEHVLLGVLVALVAVAWGGR